MDPHRHDFDYSIVTHYLPTMLLVGHDVCVSDYRFFYAPQIRVRSRRYPFIIIIITIIKVCPFMNYYFTNLVFLRVNPYLGHGARTIPECRIEMSRDDPV